MELVAQEDLEAPQAPQAVLEDPGLKEASEDPGLKEASEDPEVQEDQVVAVTTPQAAQAPLPDPTDILQADLVVVLHSRPEALVDWEVAEVVQDLVVVIHQADLQEDLADNLVVQDMAVNLVAQEALADNQVALDHTVQAKELLEVEVVIIRPAVLHLEVLEETEEEEMGLEDLEMGMEELVGIPQVDHLVMVSTLLEVQAEV